MADTIFALSSGNVPSGVAVIRVSGPDADAAFAAFAIRQPPARHARLCAFTIDGELIDRGLVIDFPEPNSFTGEHCVEFHLHGSPAVVSAVLKRLQALEGYRPAEPGEFTRRAFANGRMHLTEAESLARLIEAETEAQRRLAMTGAGGAQHALIADWQLTLTRLRARLEAEIDFSDEGDVPEDVSSAARDSLLQLNTNMKRHLSAFAGAEIVRSGFRVALAGRPNAGKSSLLNRLAGRDVALVTEIAGTTRDRIEVNLDLSGYKVVMSDIAGLRETEDRIEKMGVDLARSTLAAADLILWLDDDGMDPDPLIAEVSPIRIRTKVDIRPIQAPGDDWIAVSSLSGEGIDKVLAAILLRLQDRVPADDLLPPASERQRRHLEASIEACDRALRYWSTAPVEIVAEELRSAAFELGRIVGQTDAESLLDEVFGNFCIGK